MLDYSDLYIDYHLRNRVAQLTFLLNRAFLNSSTPSNKIAKGIANKRITIDMESRQSLEAKLMKRTEKSHKEKRKV